MKIRPNQGNPNYKKYLSSGRWIRLKEQFLLPNSECRACGSKDRLTLHHKSYENLGKETELDFIILCQRCHRRIHFNKKGNLRWHQHTLGEYQKLYMHKRRKEIRLERAAKRLEKLKEPFVCANQYRKNDIWR